MSDECFQRDPIEELVILSSLRNDSPTSLERRAVVNEIDQPNFMNQDITKPVFWGAVILATALVTTEVIYHADAYKPLIEQIYHSIVGY